MTRKYLTPIEFVNPLDSTLLTLGWATHSGGVYELDAENARTLIISHGSQGELYMNPSTAGWWSSKPLEISSYLGLTLMSDNTYVAVYADDYIDISMHGWAENIMLTQSLLKLVSADIQLAPTTGLVTSTKPIALPADPASALHAATKQYVDAAAALRVLKTGDTMTGMLTLTTPLPTPALTINAANVNSIVVTSGSVDFQDGLSVQGEINLMGFIYADAADFQGDVSFSANVASDVTMGINGSDDMWLTCTEVRLYDGITIANASKGLVKFDNGVLVLGAMGAGTFTGVQVQAPLTLPADPTLPLQAATKQYVDASGGGGGSADALHVGPDAPTDANIELWWDTDDDQDRQGINAQTGTSYTFVLGDENQLVTFTSATAVTATIPTNAVAAFPIGSRIDLAQLGAGAVTVSGAGVTIKATPSAILRANGSAATLIKYATDTWLLTGDLA